MAAEHADSPELIGDTAEWLWMVLRALPDERGTVGGGKEMLKGTCSTRLPQGKLRKFEHVGRRHTASTEICPSRSSFGRAEQETRSKKILRCDGMLVSGVEICMQGVS